MIYEVFEVLIKAKRKDLRKNREIANGNGEIKRDIS